VLKFKRKFRRQRVKDGNDRLFENIGNQLPTYTTKHPRKAKASTTLHQKPEISHKIKLTMRYRVMLSADMVFMTFWLPNAIYLGVFKTVHETRDAAFHLTPFFPQPHFPRWKPHCDETAGYLISPALYLNSYSLFQAKISLLIQILLLFYFTSAMYSSQSLSPPSTTLAPHSPAAPSMIMIPVFPSSISQCLSHHTVWCRKSTHHSSW